MSGTAVVAGRNKFVLRDTSAEVVKSLSQNELVLWMTMRRLADAKTGALCFQGKWIRAERIQREAKMGKTRRKETMKRLVGKGLVLMGQDHSVRDVADRLSGHVRKRFVFKEVQYWVSETPRQDWLSSEGRSIKPPKLRFSSAGRNEKKASAGRFLSQHKKRSINSHNPPGASSSVHREDQPFDGYGERSGNHQSGDSVFRSALDQAKQMLLKTQPAEEVRHIEFGLEVIEHRVHGQGIKPRGARYYIRAYENLKSSEKDWDLVQWYVQNPGSSDYRNKINAAILKAERAAKESGKDFFEAWEVAKRELVRE
jgi:hypothetical protein